MARSKEEINKSQAIRDALRTNPDKSPSEIAEAFLYHGDGGFNCGYQSLRRQVFRRRKWNGFCIHDQNLASGVALERGGIS